MTDEGFGRLLYTDCAPGAGRGGGGGFQVQAQSPGVDSRLSAIATSWLLYEVQDTWVSERRPVGEFPRGFAHAAAGGYGTGQGRYVGKEVMGGRQGNHLADCLLTDDPELYGTIRPAQFYGSEFWRADPWPTPDCPDYAGDLEPGPLMDLEELTGWVRARQERGPLLARLLSVLEDPDGSRVVILSADPDEAMRWIATATLLLPQRRALDISFKVFSANPARARQRVVAAPPDLYPRLAPGAVPGVFVLDAAACQADEAPVSERAAFLAGELAGDAEADPLDILDALELADELSGGNWPTGVDALQAAWAITRPDEPLHATAQVQDWLMGAGAEQLAEYGPELVEKALAASPSAGLLRWLDTAVAGRRLDFDQETVRARLLAAELAEALAGQEVPAQRLPPLRLSEKVKRDAESDVTSALLAGDRMDPGQVDRVLRLAFRHEVTLQPAPLAERLRGLAIAWIEDPARTWDPRGRMLAEVVLDEVYAVLHERFAEPLSRQLKEALPKFSGVFDSRDDIESPLYWYLQAVAVADLKGQARLERLNASLARIVTRLGENLAEGEEAARAFQRALLAWGADGEEVATLIGNSLPHYREPWVMAQAESFLQAGEKNPDAEFLDEIVKLRDNGWSPRSDRPRLDALLQGELRVREFVAEAAKVGNGDRRKLEKTARIIGEADPVVLELRAGEVLDALLSGQNPHLMGAVLAMMKREGHGKVKPVGKLLSLAVDRMKAATPGEAVEITCRLVVAVADLTAGRSGFWAVTLVKRLREYDAGLTGKDSKRWRADVRKSLEPGSAESREWEIFCLQEPLRQQGGIFQNLLAWKAES